MKAATCAIRPFAAKWYGFAIGRGTTPEVILADYWALAPFSAGWRVELASESDAADINALAAHLFGAHDHVVSVTDRAIGAERLAVVQGGSVVGVIFTSPDPVAVDRMHALQQFEQNTGPPQVLAGAKPADLPDAGAIVCSCFAVGANTIGRAIKEHDLTTVDEIAASTAAGSGCGSCISEVEALLAAADFQPSDAVAAE